MSINKCKCCGQPPFAEQVQYWMLISCCNQEIFSKNPNVAVREWNDANKPTPIYSEKRRDAAVELAHHINAVNLSADFNEMFGVA